MHVFVDEGDGGASSAGRAPGDPATVQEMADIARDYIASLPVTAVRQSAQQGDRCFPSDPDHSLEDHGCRPRTPPRFNKLVFPSMVALADEFAFADPDERFELLLDIFIDGLARRAAAG
jgi:hypothetical protein